MMVDKSAVYPKRIAVIVQRCPGGINVCYEGSSNLIWLSWYARRGDGSSKGECFAPGRRIKVWKRLWKGRMTLFFARIGG